MLGKLKGRSRRIELLPVLALLDVTQSPASLIVAQGDQAKLSCVFSKSELNVKGAVSWYKSGLEEGARSSQVVPLKGRFSLTFPKTFLNEGNGSLIISNITREDTGTYYCKVLVWEKDGEWGNGSRLIVYARPSQPEIYIKATPTPEEEMTLVCRTSGFYPADVHVSWSSADTSLPKPEDLEIWKSQDGVYQANLHLVLPAWLWHQHLEVTCIIRHTTLTDALHTTYWHSDEDPAALQLVEYLNIVKIGVILGLSVGLLITVTKRCKRRSKGKS